MELLIIVCLFLIINFYFFAILPKHKDKHNPKYYEADFKNLNDCISRAKTRETLKMCLTAVYDFQKRNLDDLAIEQDVNELIAHIDRRYLEIKTGTKFSITS